MTAALARLLPEPAPMGGPRLRDAAVAAASDGRLRGSPNLYALWRALAEARFRLVECFDRSGWRYYVLHERLDDLAREAALDDRERRLAEAMGRGESEKAVAFTLGVTPSAVSTILKTTLLKLGLRTKIELVLLVGALCAPRAEESVPDAPSSSRLRTSTPQAT